MCMSFTFITSYTEITTAITNTMAIAGGVYACYHGLVALGFLKKSFRKSCRILDQHFLVPSPIFFKIVL